MADLEISFATLGELEGAKQFADALEKNIGKMKAAGKDTAELTEQHQRLQKAIDESSGRFVKLEQEAQSARKAIEDQTRAAEAAQSQIRSQEEAQAQTANARQLNQEAHDGGTAVVPLNKTAIAAAVAGAALAGLYKAVEKGVEQFAEQERAVTALDTALAQNGLLTDELRESYQKLASQLSETTAIASADWMTVLGTLTKFGTASEEITRTAEAVKNLAGFLGGDITTAAFMVGKAVQGQFSAFTRIGFHFDETMSKGEKLESLFTQLAQRGGGQLEARANTLSGQLAGLKVAASNVWEGFGNLVSRTGVFQFAMEEATYHAKGLAEMLPTLVEQNSKLSNKSADAAKAIRDQAEAEKALALRSSEAVKALEAENRAIERRRQLTDALTNAKLATDLAEIDLAEAEGKLTPEQANLRKADVRARSEFSAAENERLGLLLRRDSITKALRSVTDPEKRASLQFDLEDANAGLVGNEAKLRSLQTTGRASIAGAEAGVRKADEKRQEEQQREDERQRKEVERLTQQHVRQLTASTRAASTAILDNFGEQNQVLRDLARQVASLQQENKQIKSRMAAGR
jgi:hypothetical protein